MKAIRLTREEAKLIQEFDRSGPRFVWYWHKGTLITRKELEEAGLLPLKSKEVKGRVRGRPRSLT